jgi:membrane-associated phospholipid phosphatase
MQPVIELRLARTSIRYALMFVALLGTQFVTTRALASDPVLDWIAIANDTAIATKSNPLGTSHFLSQLSAAVFDAVNGIDTRYQPLHIKPDARPHASARAAAVEAAYTILIDTFPALTPSLTLQRDASIAALSPKESAKAIFDGMTWGQTVANGIWSWRLTDGVAPPPPPFVGVLGLVGLPSAIGVWRPTPPLDAPGAGPQYATMTPWVLLRPSQFRLPPPNALTSPEYATDYNEIKVMGVFSGSGRSSDQSELALFWNGNTPLFWDRIAAQVSVAHSLKLSENAHLFALLNVSMTDALISSWDTKYRFVFWRPITAINEGDVDGNAATDPDPAWIPWLNFYPAGTPAHPEYPSGHSTVSGAAAAVLTSIFGDETSFTTTSDVRPGVRSFSSFSAAVAEIADARVFGGIHFRVSCIRGNALGQAVAAYVMSHAMREDDDQH